MNAEAEREAAGGFLAQVLLALSLYAIALRLAPEVGWAQGRSSAVLSVPLQVLFAAGSARFIASTGLPLARFGLTLRGAAPAALLGVIAAAPSIAAVAASKVLLLRLRASDAPLLGAATMIEERGWLAYAGLVAVYALFCFVQEFVARCALQTGLEMFLRGPRRGFWANGLTALVFATTHLHVSPRLDLTALIFVSTLSVSLLWGALFERQRSLIGVGVSHLLVGLSTFFLIGIDLR